jgi:hypothetical protein
MHGGLREKENIEYRLDIYFLPSPGRSPYVSRQLLKYPSGN